MAILYRTFLAQAKRHRHVAVAFPLKPGRLNVRVKPYGDEEGK